MKKVRIICVSLAVMLGVGFLPAGQAFAASAGPNSPTTVVSDASIGTIAWNNPTRAVSSNNQYAATANMNAGTVSRYLKATSFGFAIPSDAIIDGISVGLERKASEAGTFFENAVRIVKGGTIGATDRSSATTWPTADATTTYGGASDLWGETWTASDINNTGFGAAVSVKKVGGANGKTASVDWIYITVTYHVLITTTTSLATSGSPATYGNSVTFTATVTPGSGGAPSGTVTFKDGAVTIGSGTLNGANPGVATFSTSTLSVAGSPHSITAFYGGDSTHATSASSAVSQAITAKNLTVTGITASDKVYDGDRTATLHTGSAALVGVVSGDAVTLDVGAAVGTFDTADVGTSKTVAVSGLSISGADSGNYTLTQPTTVASIVNPLPVTSSISPTSKTVGDGQFLMTVNGSGFMPNSTVRFEGGERLTSYISDHELSATIYASDLASAGTFSVTVFNPVPGGGLSNSQTFTVNEPIPSPSVSLSASPTTITIGESSTLSWSSSNVTSCAASGEWSGSKSTSGSEIVMPVATGTKSYTLSCTGAGGTASSTATVVVNEETPPPTPSADLSIVKTDSPDPVTAGNTLSYTITVSNSGPNSAANVTVSDTLPPALVSPTVSSSQGSCSAFPCVLGSLAKDASATITVSSPVDVGAVGTITNTATVSSDTADPASSNNTSMQTTAVTPAPAPTISLSASPTTITIGESSTLSWSSSNATSCVASGEWSGSKSTSGIESVTPGSIGTKSYTLECVGAGGTVSSTASIVVEDVVIPPPPPTPSADLSITQLDSPDPVGAGSTLTYIITVSNDGPSDATSTTVSDTLPTALTAPTVMPSQGSCAAFPCDLGTILIHRSATITVTSPIDLGASGVITNTATVSSGTSDPSASNNTSVETTTVTATSTPSAPRGGMGSITPNVKPVAVIFSGTAFPNARISLVDRDMRFENAVDRSVVAGTNGAFRIELDSLIQGPHSFGLLIKDADGRVTQTKFFTIDVVGQGLTVKDIVVPPTLEIPSRLVSRGQPVIAVGSATPGYDVLAEVDGTQLQRPLSISNDGTYKATIDTSGLDFGTHSIRVRQADVNRRQTSDYSTTNTFEVSRLVLPKTDLNGDGVVDVKDWSIFLADWASTDANQRKQIDFNGDGKTDASDFSIFMRAVRK